MVTGWVFGLSPSFLHEELDIQLTRPLVGGLFAALVVFTTGASQLVLRRHHGRRPTTVGLFAVVVGMGMIAASSIPNSLAIAIVGGVIAGAGCGVTQMNAMAAVQRIAPLHARSSVMSTYATLCYLAISVPVIIAGQAADHFGLEVVTAWYFLGLVLVVTFALFVSRRPETGWARS
jgi:MFS family permease